MAKMVLTVKEDRNGVTPALIKAVQDIVEPQGKHSPVNCIERFRKLMLIHSHIYYKCGENAISDYQWQDWAYMLVILQDSFPDACNQGFYDEYFIDWDGSSGYDLPDNADVRAWADDTFRFYSPEKLHHPEQ